MRRWLQGRGLGSSVPMPSQSSFTFCVEGRAVLEYAIECGRRIERIGAEAVHRAAESGHVGEGVQMASRQVQCLVGSHGEAGHRPVIAVGNGAEGRVDHGNDLLDHHILEGADISGAPAAGGPNGPAGTDA